MLTSNQNQKIFIDDKRKQFLLRLDSGIYSILFTKFYGYVFFIYLALLFLWEIYAVSMNNGTLYNLSVLIISLTTLLYLSGHPLKALKMNRAFLRIGFTNSVGIPPTLLYVTRDTSKYITFICISDGIPLDYWIDKQLALENALNLTIESISASSEYTNRIRIKAYKGRYVFPEKIEWNSSYLSYDSSELVMGEQLTGQFSISLNDYPHILIGGATGSGKSVLLKSLLMQCVCHKNEVYIIDFKGGIDYFPIWHVCCNIVTDYSSLISALKKVTDELQARKKVLLDAQVANIDEYNLLYPAPMQRIIIAFDEVAEALDKSGLGKTEKEQILKIESYLSTIARTGRAMGIHLILATQRPDANILTGQIKSNINYRICGRADNVLSQIILDTAIADDKIPKDAKGIFINQDNVVFKGYIFDENEELKDYLP